MMVTPQERFESSQETILTKNILSRVYPDAFASPRLISNLFVLRNSYDFRLMSVWKGYHDLLTPTCILKKKEIHNWLSDCLYNRPLFFRF